MRLHSFVQVRRKDFLLATSAGLVLTLCFPLVDLAPLAWGALIPLLYLVSDNKVSACFTLGWIAGVFHGLTLLYWITYAIHRYGNLPLPAALIICFLLVAYLALFPAFFCAGLGWLRQHNVPWLFVAPFLWVSLELGKARLLTGFPWENLGYSQYRWLSVIQLADIAGVFGISFVLVLSNVLLFTLIFHSRLQSKRALRPCASVLLIGLIASVIGYGQWRLVRLESFQSSSFKIGLVQGNIAQDTKWDPAFQQTTIDNYVRLSQKVTEQEPDLIVWPETATPFYFWADRKNTANLLQALQEIDSPLLFGSPAFRKIEEQLRFYNRAYLLNEDGMVVGFYDKIHLVPFGEYVPWKRMLFFVDKLVQAAGDFASGEQAIVLNLAPAKVGVLICYEAIFPELSRDLVNGGANLLVNITNDAWFGRSSAPYQHLSMAVLRAVENRVPMARCANTGISGFIDVRGRILQTTDLFEEAISVGTLELGAGKTPYTRYGDWFAWSCLGITLLVFTYSMIRSATSKQSGA
jgi:apolipoprotein N-acyltransferase